MQALSFEALQAAAPFGALDLSDSGMRNAARSRVPLGVVVHTPGRPFMVHALDAARKGLGRAPTAKELDSLAARRFDAAKYQPGYCIGQTGSIYRLDLDTRRTWHAGKLGGDDHAEVYSGRTWAKWASPSDGSGWCLHGRDPTVVYDYWFAAFPGFDSPVQVFPWGASPNDAIGIDLFPHPETGMTTPAQASAFVALVRALAGVHGFPLDNRHVTTHTLCSPVERGTVRRGGTIVGAPWDLDPRHWPHDAVLARLASGAP